MTRDEWTRVPRDYKVVSTSACGRYRYRMRLHTGCRLVNVFLTDQKRVDPPSISIGATEGAGW